MDAGPQNNGSPCSSPPIPSTPSSTTPTCRCPTLRAGRLPGSLSASRTSSTSPAIRPAAAIRPSGPRAKPAKASAPAVATARRRGPLRRQDPHRRARLLARRAQRPLRHADQPGGARPRAGRLVVRFGFGGGGKALRHRARQRHRRLGARAGFLLRHHRAPPDPWPHRHWRRHAACPEPRHGRLVRRTIDVFERVGAVLLGEDAAGPPSRASSAPRMPSRSSWRAKCSALAGRLPRRCGRLGSAGGEIAPEGLAEWQQDFRILQGYEAWRAHGPWITSRKPDLGPPGRLRFEVASKVTAADYADAAARSEPIRERVRGLLGADGVIMLPTLPTIAPASMRARRSSRPSGRAPSPCCASPGLAGCPQVSLPGGTVAGCPLGLSLIGRPDATGRCALARSSLGGIGLPRREAGGGLVSAALCWRLCGSGSADLARSASISAAALGGFSALRRGAAGERTRMSSSTPRRRSSSTGKGG